jgi:hypothetical protein
MSEEEDVSAGAELLTVQCSAVWCDAVGQGEAAAAVSAVAVAVTVTVARKAIKKMTPKCIWINKNRGGKG